MKMTLLSFSKKIYNRINELNAFSNFSALKPNKTKCEIAGTGVLNGIQLALCGMKCVDIKDTLKAYFWYRNTLFYTKTLSRLFYLF